MHNYRLKKNLSLMIAILLLSAVISPWSASAANYTFKSDLELGDEGAEVLALQNLLVQGGYLVITKPSPKYGYKPNGYYGEQTKTAVAKWQKSMGISPVSGIFGPMSRAKANAGYLLIASRGNETETETKPSSSTGSTSTSSPEVSNSKVIAANTCTNWTYSPWSACSVWGIQTRNIIASWPSGCAGGSFVLSQSCTPGNDTALNTLLNESFSDEPSIGTYRPASLAVETFDDRLISAAFVDKGQNVGLTCKPWINKVISRATNKNFILPLTREDNYTWDLNTNNRNGQVVAKNCSIEQVSRGDIIQMRMTKNNWPHTAIIVSATPTGMVWAHSNWQQQKVASVDFITYAYFKTAFGQDYSVYHLQ